MLSKLHYYLAVDVKIPRHFFSSSISKLCLSTSSETNSITTMKTMAINNRAILQQIKWNDAGLLPVIAQDHLSKQVLMLAWMNSDALLKSIELQEAVYWSRSRQRLWHKGEVSGHTQKIKEIRLDCDGDTLLLLVEQVGGIACHTGRAHCMFKRYSTQQGWETVDEVLIDPSEIYT